MKTVLIPTKLDKVAANLLTQKGYTVIQDADTDLLTLCKAHPEAEALIVRSEKITPEIMDVLPSLRTIVRAGAGYNTIDIKYARRNNIDVMNTPGANSNGVAEEVIGMMLAASRFMLPADIDTRAGGWSKKKFMGHEITGKTLGIVGLGNIGQLVARRLSGFDMKILAYDPIVSKARAEELGVELVDLAAIFSRCDYITLHIPENNETRGMLNKSLLDLVKPGAVIINCARAGIVNEDDLRAAKAEKKLVYCNDVYAADVPGPKSIADVADIMLPHLGANTYEANFNAAKRAAEEIIEYFEQGITKFVVNKDLPDGLDPIYQRLANRLSATAKALLGGKEISAIRCSYYGALEPFAKWFTAPICASISDSFDPHQSHEEAINRLKDTGVLFEVRDSDGKKPYGNSMTIDMEANGAKISLRGTVTENTLILSRVNDFNHVYLLMSGNLLFVEYVDRPGVLAKITAAVADAQINIEDIHAPRDAEGKHSLAVLYTDRPLTAAQVAAIGKSVDARLVASVNLPA